MKNQKIYKMKIKNKDNVRLGKSVRSYEFNSNKN